MSKIVRLSDDVVNQIAAGEVVERPASVVKELVENAIDAQASRIQIEVEGGGKRLIRVRDDGDGMEPVDLGLAIERHATSKLRAAADLEAISSHGFRGEALPSIGSVAELSITSRPALSADGASVSVRFGRASGVKPAAHPKGTTVEVRHLFAEIPARRKFLKADATELRHIVETVSLLALVRPDIGFTLHADGRSVIEALEARSSRQRLEAVMGRETADALVDVERAEGGIAVSGFTSREPNRGGSRPDLRIFVNGRAVKDRALSKAVTEAYRALGHFDAKPETVLFVDVGAETVDVNVHPAKTEVRFRDASRVFESVVRAIRAALGEAARPSGAGIASHVTSAARPLDSPPIETTWHAADGVAAGPGQKAVAFASSAQAALQPEGPQALGQYRDTYIVAVFEGDLWLFDQHTAHERARFESILARKAEEALESQRLLMPSVVDLSPSLRLLAEECLEELRHLGFEIEDFGGRSLSVSALPALLAGRPPAEALGAVLRQLDGAANRHWAVEGRKHRLAASLACHSAVRAGERLTLSTMQAVVSGLAATEQPEFCPHGRPTRHRIAKDEIARWFERTGWRRS